MATQHRACARPLLIALAIVAAAPAALAEPTAFVGATLIDGTGGAPLRDAVIVTEGDRILSVGARATTGVPSNARIVDVAGKWIIPGLIDAHVHFFQSGGLYTRPDVIDLRSLRAYEDEVARVRGGLDVTLARYLASGITAVIDVGGPMWNFAVRARAEALRFAPSVAVAGPLLAPYAPPALAADDPPIVRIRTPAEARAEVRIQLAHEPDLIKIWMVLRGTTLEGERPWVRAAIAESHAAGVPVVVHATRRRIARAAIEDGADILAHGIEDREIDDSLLRLMKRRGALVSG